NERVIDTIHLPQLDTNKIQNIVKSVISTYDADVTTLDNVLNKAESEYIYNVYLRFDKNKTRTAKELGISLRSLYYKMEKYGIS
ncbi:MAG: helix-turn-helix domain-containing protein, partial [Tissierellia bacterium]|nr:helix-turn-helix domain-containing protein [Tissierellia bacterium]